MTVSVCVPVYNRASELDRALRSVVEQTYQDLDIVVLDNASTDDSHAVASRYARADPRIRVHRNDELIGKAENWRRCLEFARGEYVKLLFSDDWLAPTAIERAVAVLAAQPRVGFVYSAMTWSVGDTEHPCYTGDGDRRVSAQEFLCHSATVADIVPVSASCVLLRTADAQRFFEERIPSRLPEDTHGIGIGYSGMLLWRCCDHYPEVHHLGEVLTYAADPQTGEVNSRTRYRERYEMLWWGHRNAFAHFVRTCGQPRAVLRELVTAMFVSTVPLRPKGFRLRLPRFRLLFPDLTWRDLRPFGPLVRPILVHRLRTPPDPVEIIG